MSTTTLRGVAAAMLLTFVIARGTASAQFRVDAWTTERGLPQATVINATQTPDGFLWASTLGGLVRFDGVRFTVFDTASNPELPTSRLGAVYADASNAVWVVTEDRKLLRFRDGTFQLMTSAEGFPGGPVISSLRDRVVPFRTRIETANGIVIAENGRLGADPWAGPRASAALRPIGEAIDGARWFVDATGLAHRYAGARLTRSARFPAERAGIVYEDRAGRVWMRNKTNGTLICVTGSEVRDYGAADGVPAISSMWTLEEADGTIWFAEASGLVRFRDGRFKTFTTQDGLPDNNVYSVYRDREGSLWVGTQRGLARIVDQPVTSYSVEQGLAARNTYPLLQDRRGDIWIGGWNGLTRYRQGRFENVTQPADVVTRMILSFAETRDGAVWVGLYGGGVRRLSIDDRDGRIRAVTVPGTPSHVYAIHESPGGDLWFGGDEGAVRFHGGVLDQPLPQTEGASVFYEDERGLWIGTADGLVRYARGQVTRFAVDNGFAGKRVRMIHPGPGGALWIGTYDTGLFRYRDGRFSRFTMNEGLPANGAFQILEDAEARFWISSNSGIYRVARSELDDVADGRRRRVTAVRYGHDDGMTNQECNGLGRPAGVKAADGRFWFPTQDGVAVVDPRAAGRQPAPPVTILDVAVGGEPVPLRDRIEIRGGGNSSIDVRYAALTFVRPELTQFKYRMENLETEWHDDFGEDRTARYARLPSGNFRFRVIAANREGVWNETGASLAVVVVPPFWRTTWFSVLMVGVVFAAGFGVHRVRLGVLERERAVQEAFARQLIDTQESDRRRIAAELHDGVSQTLVVIKNWARLGTAGREPQRLEQIAGAAEQALGEVRGVVHELLPYHLERLGFATAVQEVVARVSDASGVAITCDIVPVDDCLSPANGLRLFRVLQEGLNNVLKHAGATEVTINGTRVGDTIVMRLSDNGRGFDPAAARPTNAGHGFGLIGMTERVRMMGGSMAIESAPGAGTTITIELRCDAKASGVSA